MEQINGVKRMHHFTDADSRVNLKDCSQSGPIPIMVIGDNPSIIASTRAKVSNDWGRYQMDSVQVNTKSGASVVANGIIVSVRMAL